jgi:DNA-binding ferritin-like protein
MKDFLANMFFCADQIKVWHLQTKGYAMHLALGSFYDTITDFTDDFAEKFMQGGPRLKSPVITEKFSDFTDVGQVTKYLDKVDAYVGKLRTELEGRTDLVNMLDDLRASINKTKYLLTLS